MSRVPRPNPRAARLLSAALAAALLAGCGAQRPASPTVALAQPVERRPWSFGGIEGRRLRTEHYDVFTTSNVHARTERLARFLEAARGQYETMTGLAGPGADEQDHWAVYLLADRNQWAALTEQVVRERAGVYLRVESGGYSYAGVCVFWDISPVVTYVIAAHEGMHQFLYYRTRQGLPAWVEEGLATLAEGFSFDRNGDYVFFHPQRNTLRQEDLRRSILSGRLRRVEQLALMDAEDNATGRTDRAVEYYGQLWALLLTIYSDPQYAAGVRRMLADAGEGRLRDELGIPRAEWARLVRDAKLYNREVGRRALTHYIDADLSRLQARYEAHARRLAGL